MVYHGKVLKGTIVLEGKPELPEGASVSVEVLMDDPACDEDSKLLAEELLKLAGSCEGLPTDYSSQIDHYLYGTPKR
ncbi:MAG: hypothetical protein FLDDKLPJ_01240 [Phycisphaerae bacterium]|nr:hypothetical protein [Phycisphaerae bacterium]